MCVHKHHTSLEFRLSRSDLHLFDRSCSKCLPGPHCVPGMVLVSGRGQERLTRHRVSAHRARGLQESAAWPGPSPWGALSEWQVHPLLLLLPSAGASAASGRTGPVAEAAEARRTGTGSWFPLSSGDRHPWLPVPGQFPSSAATCWPLCRAISQPHTRAVIWGLRWCCLGRGARVYDSTAAWLLETKSCVLWRLPR